MTGYGARAALLLDSQQAMDSAARGNEINEKNAESPASGTVHADAINEKNEIRVHGRGYWREEARTAFLPCRDADDVRAAFRAVWRRMEGQSEAAQDVVLAEFTAALRRFGQGGKA